MHVDWAERMNRVVDYVENHLDGRVDEETVAQIAACPYPLLSLIHI